MAATVPDVGDLATLELATTNLTLECLNITPGEVSVAVIDTTHLGTPLATGTQQNAATAMGGRRKRMGPISVEFHWNPAILAAVRVSQEITITYPDGTIEEGFGFVHKVGKPQLTVDGKQVGTLEIQPDTVGWPITEA